MHPSSGYKLPNIFDVEKTLPLYFSTLLQNNDIEIKQQSAVEESNITIRKQYL